MSLKLGTQNISGISQNTKYNAHHLLDFKWTDCIMNDVSWLRSDTFSWQSGDVYTSAYNHLVADLQGATSETETVGSYTVTFYRATDGHKICLADQETTVLNIYNESGTAWYYILDTTNTRFKLPRTSHGDIVEKYQSGTQWYKVYSDGWCEQGGYNLDTTDYALLSISLLKVYKDTNYTLTITSCSTNGTNSAGTPMVMAGYTQKFTSYFTRRSSTNPYRAGVSWQACGYIANYPENSQYKYLYFYVGDYTQTAIEQTAGLNAELFNDKADADLSNISASQGAKNEIISWGIPDYSLGILCGSVSNATVNFTCPSDGIIVPDFISYAENNAYLSINDVYMYHRTNTAQYMTSCTGAYPVKKGDVVKAHSSYSTNNYAQQNVKFYPMKGVS